MSVLPGRKRLEELGTDCSTFLWAWILSGLLPKALAFPERMVSVLWVSPSPDWWGLSAWGWGGWSGDGRFSPCPLFWRLCWLGTLHRENSLTVRSAGCRVPGEGQAWGSFVLQLERGVGFQRAGLGESDLPSRW